MAFRRPWSDQETVELKRLVKEGYSRDQLVEMMHRPKGTLSCKMAALKLRTSPRRSARLWTEAEKREVIALRAKGWTLVQIGKKIDRHPSCIKDMPPLLEDKPKEKRKMPPLPVAQSDFMKPLTREQLMAGRA